MIVPSSNHAPPREFRRRNRHDGAACDGNFLQLAAAKNATHWPSGEKNGLGAPSVPASGVARISESRRMNRGGRTRSRPPDKREGRSIG